MKCSRLKIDHVHILIIIFIFRRESKCCSCERIFLRPIDAVYDSSVNKPDQLRWIMIDISWDLLSDWSRNLFCLYVCASPLFFFSYRNEDRILLPCTGNLNIFREESFISGSCVWFYHSYPNDWDTKQGTIIRCFVMHLRIASSELFFSCLLRIRMCWTEMRCNF